MARSIEEIQDSIIAAKDADATLAPLLTSTSRVAVWRLWTWVVATAMNVMESLFDFHKQEVQDIIATEKPHSLLWYITKVKAYQHGVTLPPDTDIYPVVPPVDPAVLVVEFAAGVELSNQVRIKVAKTVGSDLGPLSGPQLAGCITYMNRIKDAGVRVSLTTGDADNFQLQLSVFYDPLVLDATGARLDGTSGTPVQDAINTFLKKLGFNGLYVNNKLMEYLEANVEGVRIALIRNAQANYGSTSYVTIFPEYVPDAGYMRLDETYFNVNVIYLAHDPI